MISYRELYKNGGATAVARVTKKSIAHTRARERMFKVNQSKYLENAIFLVYTNGNSMTMAVQNEN